MKAIYEFDIDYGRMGDLKGVFVADQDEVAEMLGRTVYLGEVLGKHSDVSVAITDETLTVKTDDQDFIRKFEEIMGKNYSSGTSLFGCYCDYKADGGYD